MLYYAMLDLRRLSGYFDSPLRFWNPLAWRKDREQVKRAAEIADWLHNLARYSAVDFRGFVEEWFWTELTNRDRRHPHYGLQSYRAHFDRCLAASGGASAPLHLDQDGGPL
jgi:hypothetical protein